MAQLLRVRQIEEEQSRLQLEGALAAEQGVERALQLALGRKQFLRDEARKAILGVQGNAHAHVAGQVDEVMLQRRAVELESRGNRQALSALKERLLEARHQCEVLRAAFLASRVRRMQVETVISEAAEVEALAAAHRHQSALDDWFGSRAGQKKSRGRVV